MIVSEIRRFGVGKRLFLSCSFALFAGHSFSFVVPKRLWFWVRYTRLYVFSPWENRKCEHSIICLLEVGHWKTGRGRHQEQSAGRDPSPSRPRRSSIRQLDWASTTRQSPPPPTLPIMDCPVTGDNMITVRDYSKNSQLSTLYATKIASNNINMISLPVEWCWLLHCVCNRVSPTSPLLIQF